MNDPSSNPIYVVFLFLLRCLVPIAVLFGISYLLRKMGVVASEAPEPPDDRDDDELKKTASPAAETNTKADGEAGEIIVTPKKTGKTGPKTPGKNRSKKKLVAKPKPKTTGKSRGGKKPVAKPRSRSK